MKRRFNFLLTALLLFASAGRVFAAVYEVSSTAQIASATTVANGKYYLVTDADLVTTPTTWTFTSVPTLITELASARVADYALYVGIAAPALSLIAVNNANGTISDILEALIITSGSITEADLKNSPATKIGDDAFTAVTGLTTADLTGVTEIGANQVKRTKLSNQFFQILNAVSRIKPAFLKARFIGLFPNDLQGKFSHCREIFSGMSFPCPAGIFSECYVQMPVQLIFNAPMTSDRCIETTCVHALFIADAITDFLTLPVFNHP
ncbi:hypothetical protein Barb6XT_02083 [Bacteroidales bacterium Barb6XT]|nr:hypothetical protein Barb6XT_02083 [Bacteroidales bacterium Barb6XT]